MMYFWNIDALKRQIIADYLTESDRFVYGFINIMFGVVAYEFFSYSRVDSPTMWSQLEPFINFVIVAVGVFFAYRANGGADGKDFLGRYFSVSFVVTIRFSALLIPVFVVLAMYESVYVEGGSDIVTSPMEVIILSLWSACLYANIVKHIGQVCNTQENALKDT